MPLYALEGIEPELPASGRYYVAPSAQVMGRVRLREDVSIWFNAVLRGDNELIAIGARSNIQDNCILHVDPGKPLHVGADCTVGHNVILHGCTIASNVLIGMGAIVMNGVRINQGSIVGAGAVIPEGKEFPESSLIVGSPARVVRRLDESSVKAIAAGADNYVRRWKSYRQGLRPLT